METADEMHRRGIPMRHLGLLRNQFWRPMLAKARPMYGTTRLPFECGGEAEAFDPWTAMVGEQDKDEVMEREKLAAQQQARRQVNEAEVQRQRELQEAASTSKARKEIRARFQNLLAQRLGTDPAEESKAADSGAEHAADASRRGSHDSGGTASNAAGGQNEEPTELRPDPTLDPTLDVAPGDTVLILGRRYTIDQRTNVEHGPVALTMTEPFEGEASTSVTVWTGAVEDQCNSAEVRAILLAELVARAMKVILRRLLRGGAMRADSGAVQAYDARALSHVFNCMSGSSDLSHEFWQVEVLATITHTFGHRAVSATERYNLRAFALPVLDVVLRRLCSMCHVVFAPYVRHPDPVNTASGAADGRAYLQWQRVYDDKDFVPPSAPGDALHMNSKLLAESEAAGGNVADSSLLQSAKETIEAASQRRRQRGASKAQSAPVKPHLPASLDTTMPSLRPAPGSLMVQFLRNPDGFVFDMSDFNGALQQPRVKHNLPFVDFARAQVLAARARAERAASYRSCVLRDRPIGYWPLHERRASTIVCNIGAGRNRLDGRVKQGLIFEVPSPLKNDGSALEWDKQAASDTPAARKHGFYGGSLCARNTRKQKGTIDVTAHTHVSSCGALVPLDPTTGFSVEAWAKCEGGHGLVRTIVFSPRFALSVLKTGEWAFTIYCSGRTDGGSTVDITLGGPQCVLGQWYYVVGTFDGTMMRLYLNGIMVASAGTKQSNALLCAFP